MSQSEIKQLLLTGEGMPLFPGTAPVARKGAERTRMSWGPQMGTRTSWPHSRERHRTAKCSFFLSTLLMSHGLRGINFPTGFKSSCRLRHGFAEGRLSCRALPFTLATENYSPLNTHCSDGWPAINVSSASFQKGLRARWDVSM